MAQSKKYTVNKTDINKWVRNGIIFLTPALLVVLADLQGILPTLFQNSAYAGIFIFVGERLIDLARKWLSGR